jgi:signal transduction histidine kinase
MSYKPEAGNDDAVSLKLCSFRLCFIDPETERRFAAEHLAQSLPFMRIAILSGALLYCLFGLLDIYIVPNALAEVWLIRYVFVAPSLVAISIFTYSRYFRRVAQFTLALGMLIPGLGILGMVSFIDPPGSYLYYAGLTLVIIYCTSLCALRYLYATAISLMLFGAYHVIALYVNPIPSWALTNNAFFLAVALGVAVFSSYALELYIRRTFINNQLLLREKERSEELLVKARAASDAKSEFLAVMSHELRTPLNAVLGFSEVLKQEMFGPLGSDRYRSYVDDIHDSGKFLLNLINDILDLSKAESGKLTLAEEEVDPAEPLDRCLRMFREKAAKQGVRLALEVPDSTSRLRADPRLLNQLLINLISNAVKFTMKGGSVIISAADEGDAGYRIRIEDSGIGIAADDLPKVVEPFVQVESAFAREHEGTGLGLPLVKKIMELHGGELDIASEIGVGTTVTVCFPAARVLEGAREALPRQAAIA